MNVALRGYSSLRFRGDESRRRRRGDVEIPCRGAAAAATWIIYRVIGCGRAAPRTVRAAEPRMRRAFVAAPPFSAPTRDGRRPVDSDYRSDRGRETGQPQAAVSYTRLS